MTRFLVTTSVAAAALVVSGCGEKAQDQSATTNVVAPSVPTASPLSPGQAFANSAGASDAFEIEISKLAATNSASASIKAFATKMISAHSQSTEKLKAASAPSISPDPILSSEQQQKLDTLKAATGPNFDKLFIAEQKAAHQNALDTLRAYSTSGEYPALKSFASEMVPTVAAHLNMANALKP